MIRSSVFSLLLFLPLLAACDPDEGLGDESRDVEQLRIDLESALDQIDELRSAHEAVPIVTAAHQFSGAGRAATAYCPTGVAVGGGCDCQAPETIVDSSPTDCETGQCMAWDCSCSNGSVMAHVLCAQPSLP